MLTILTFQQTWVCWKASNRHPYVGFLFRCYSDPGYFLFLIRPEMCETDLTDFQWQGIQEILPDTPRREHSLRLIVNALLYLTKSGFQWRLLLHEFPAFPLVY